MFIFSLNFISAIPPQTNINTNEGLEISYPKFDSILVGKDFNLSIHVFNISNGLIITNADCELEIYNQSGNHLIDNLNLTQISDEYNVLLSGENLTNEGIYSYNIYCNTTSLGGFVDGNFQITTNGRESDSLQLYTRIFLLLFFMFTIFLIQWNKGRIDYDKWYNQIAEKYRTKNTFRWVLSALGYNLLKNSYVFSYLVGLLGMLVLTELILLFNITSVLLIMKIVLALYTWGALVVVMVFFSQVQEWIFEWKEDLEKIKWGELTSPK
jgi:hypothetical protein